MAIDKIKIINLSVVLIGSKTLQSPTDNTKAARLASQLFDISYRAMLELPVNWVFATTRENITGNVTTAPTVGQYSYRYKLPGKCLRVIAQVDRDDDDKEYTHRIENYVDTSENSFPALITNEITCYIRYIYDLGQDNEIRRWPAWFSRIVALDLAILMCEPMKQDKVKKNQLLAMMVEPAMGWMTKAIQANGMYGADTSVSTVEDLDRGNRDVLNASAEDLTLRRYIVERD